MNAPTYRASCGTHIGMKMHQEHLEEFCGQCLVGEAGRRLYRELIPTRPTSPPAPVPVASDPAAVRDLVDAVVPLRVLDGAA